MKCALSGAVLWMKIAISWTWKRLKINNVFITLNDVDQNAKKKILDLWDVPALRYFSMPVDCQQLNNGLFWTPINIEREISLFLLFLLKFSALTHFPGPFVVLYSMLPSIRTVPVSGHLKQKLTFWGAVSVLSKWSISNESWTFHL